MMLLHTIFTFSFIALVACGPIHQRDVETPDQIAARFTTEDLGILNYALTLEHLENAFYRDGLSMFNATDFSSEAVHHRFTQIAQHEKTHVETLITVIESLNGTAVPECQYDFGYSDMAGFLAVARALENTGVSAYDGAIDKIHDKDLVTAGATIATVEARHASYLNQLTGHNPFPGSFDTPLTAQQIVSIASAFITSCPYDLGVTPFPALKATLTDQSTFVVVSFNKSLEQPDVKFYCSWLYSNSQDQTDLHTDYYCQVPKNATGDVYLFVTNSTDPITKKNTSSIIAGPAVVSIDEA